MTAHPNSQPPGAPVVLLTDFGTQDPYVGVMKGVILNLAPGAPLIDLTHHIPPQDVRRAAETLAHNYRYFPAGSVFLVVVDPGVGSDRRAVAVRSGVWSFIAPDNGVLAPVLAEIEADSGAAWEAVAIGAHVNPHPVLSTTFHGRDLFAPAAARLARGEALLALGPPLDTLTGLESHRLLVEGHRIEGVITAVDHFGNALSNIGVLRWVHEDGGEQIMFRPRTQPNAAPLTFDARRVQVRIGRHVFTRIVRTYAAVAPGQATPLISSAGQLEIAVNQGSAAESLRLEPGMKIALWLD